MVPQSVAASADRDDFGMVQEPVENGGGAGDIPDQLAPIFQRPIAGHDCGTRFVAAHDDLEQVFARPLGQLLHAHVIDHQQIGLQVTREHLVVRVEGLFVQEVPHDVEDRVIQHDEALLDRLVGECLHQKALARTGWAEEQHVPCFADEAASGQIEDLLFVDGGIEGKIKFVERLELAKLSRLDATLNESFGTN